MLLLLSAACQPDYQAAPLVKRLEGYTWLDLGAVPPGQRATSLAPLFSLGAGSVTVRSVTVEGDGFFVQDPGESTLSGYDEAADDDTLPIDVTFAPATLGELRASLVVVSDDNVSTERDADGDAVWTTTLRGLGREVCARRWPAEVDFGHGDGGAQLTTVVHVENCGTSTLTIAAGTVTGADDAYVRDVLPAYVLPGTTEDLTLAWDVAGTLEATLTLVVDDDALADEPVHLVGNAATAEPDDDGDGYSVAAGDCDDADAAVHPGAEEDFDGRDDDCDGVVDEGTDQVDDDGDGHRELEDDPAQNDCDDVDPWTYPGAVEDCDGVDNDCDGEVDEDACPPEPGTIAASGAASCATAPVAGPWIVASLVCSSRRRRRKIRCRSVGGCVEGSA